MANYGFAIDLRKSSIRKLPWIIRTLTADRFRV